MKIYATENYKKLNGEQKDRVSIEVRAGLTTGGGGFFTVWKNGCNKKLTEVLTNIHDTQAKHANYDWNIMFGTRY